MQAGKQSWPPSVEALAAECPNLRLSTMPEVAFDPWWELASRLRYARFYLRFLRPEYRDTPELLTRARNRAPRWAVRLGERVASITAAHRGLNAVIECLDQSTRSARAFHEFLATRSPDVVVTTPLIVLKTAQLDLARAAMELGLRNVFAVASWDHLSSKSELPFEPQRIFVWNDVQKREAVNLHRQPPDRVVVTGAQLFDEWFGKRPSTTREDFCRRVGLPPDRPFVLYVCSSLLEGSTPEPPFVLRWVQTLRHSGDATLRDCGILIRPHFRRGRDWRGVDVAALGNVVCWPPEGDVPAEARSKTDYFDSLYHASAIVGLNTSAMIEGAILGRPVCTVLIDEFKDSQEGTLHFHYLLNRGGPLHVSRSLDQHARDLAARLAVGPQSERSVDFVQTFVRPHGLGVSATDRFVGELEALAATPAPAAIPVPAWTRLVRPLLYPFARAAAARARRVSGDFRRRKEQLLVEHRLRKAANAAARANRLT